MFGTSGIRGEVGEKVTAELATAVGRALGSEVTGPVVVGRDTRATGRMLADAVSVGARECGADVVRLGIAATPSIARGVDWYDADAGVAVTASHNPPKDNGLKLWNPSGMAFDSRQRSAITRRLREDDYDLQSWQGVGTETTVSEVGDRHAATLAAACEDLSGLSVVLDVGNGAGGVTAAALRQLGCDIQTLNGQGDSHFPGREIEPTAESLADLGRYVANGDADLGLAHDGDADRLMAVTDDGEFVPGDVLLALFARERAEAGDRVAAPLNTSILVDDVLQTVDASVVRTRVGDVFVAEAATSDDVVFGGEPSGAWIWPEETLCPDGALAACRLAEVVSRGEPLSSTVADIGTYPTLRESVSVADKHSVMDRLTQRIHEQYETVEDTDGVRVDLDDGWFLVRASGTQPLVRVTAEAQTEHRAEELFRRARTVVSEAT